MGLDADENGDISLDEMVRKVVEIGKERKAHQQQHEGHRSGFEGAGQHNALHRADDRCHHLLYVS